MGAVYDQWGVVIREAGIFSITCDGVPVGGACCEPCAAAWSVHSQRGAGKGGLKSKLYSHVIDWLRRNPVTVEATVKPSAGKLLPITCKDAVLERNNGQLQRIWPSLTNVEKSSLTDQLHNMNRKSLKERKGSRWTSEISHHNARRVMLNGGASLLKHLSENGHRMPSRMTIWKGVQRFTAWGVQMAEVDSLTERLLLCDITVSFDEIAVNQCIAFPHVGDMGYRMDGVANIFPLDSVTNVLNQFYRSPIEFPSVESCERASNVMLFLAHTHNRSKERFGVSLYPSNKKINFTDLLLLWDELEIAVSERDGSVGNIACDNAAAQPKLMWAVMKPFTLAEDERLLDCVHKHMNYVCLDNGWMRVAAELGRTVGIAKARYLKLKELRSREQPVLSVDNAYEIPYPGGWVAGNPSIYSHRQDVWQSVSPEWRHLVRLLVQHIRDKPHKLLVMSFLPSSPPALYGDFYALYVNPNHNPDPENYPEFGTTITLTHDLKFESIDLSDSAQSDERCMQLLSFKNVPSLCARGSTGSALFVLLSASYLRGFVDDKKSDPVPLKARCFLLFCHTE